jgi:hypothetical protein
MGRRAKAGTCLASLVKLAVPLCQQAERECPRQGPGRKPEIPDWVLAALIMVAILKRKKTKSAQYCFLKAHRRELLAWLGADKFPARSTYFDRYRRAWKLFQVAIEVQGRRAIAEGVADPQLVAIDKSLIAARGPLWHRSDRQRQRIPKGLRGVDRESAWGCSQHDGWVQGYSFEVIVTATVDGGVFPLAASADTASAKETQTCADKIDALPAQTEYVLVDSGYDSNDLAENMEHDAEGRCTGRRFLCPENRRGSKRRPGDPPPKPRDERHARRLARKKFLKSPRGRKLYARRGLTVEPFHDWFKNLFELDQRVWHRGLDNNRTQLLAALFACQLLVRYNHRKRRPNGQVKWILDSL